MRAYPLVFSCLLLAATEACVEPAFEPSSPDAAMSEIEGPDAGAPAEDARVELKLPDTGTQTLGALKPGAEKLLGTYAMRAHFYVTDVPLRSTRFLHELVLLADIHPNATNTALLMETTLCQDTMVVQSSLPGANGASFIAHPENWAKRTYDVSYDRERFSTTRGQLAVGYDPAPAPGCTAGVTKAPVRKEQTWIAGGQCDCPTGPSLPKQISDCRVIDYDNDQQPGAGVQITTGASGTQVVGMRMLDTSQIVNGVIDSEGKHRAEYLKAEDHWVLRCMGDPCNADYAYCRSGVQPALFVPLEGSAWSCSAVMGKLDELFGKDPIAYPSGC